LHATSEAVHYGLSILDKDYNILYQNKLIEDTFGGIGEKCYKVYEGKNKICSNCPVRKSLSDSKPHKSIRAITMPSGKLEYWENLATPIKDVRGEIIACLEICKNINTIKKMEDMYSQYQQDWEDIFNTITDMITIHDHDFNIIFANAAAKKNLNLPSQSRKKLKCFEYFHGKNCPPLGCPSCNCLKTGIPVNFEKFEPHLNKYIEIRAIPRMHGNEIKGIIHIVRDITDRKKSEQKIKQSRKNLRNLTAHLLSIREREQESLAREIHDELSQLLTGVHMELMLLDKKIPELNSELHKMTKSILTMLDTSIQSVQRISSSLRPKMLDELGLSSAIRWYASKFQERTRIICRIASRLKIKVLCKNCNTNIYRIFQEALTNVYRHAHATRVEVSLSKYKGQFIMKVSDNGKGIAEEQINSSQSLGLIGMRERVRMMRGRFEIHGSPNRGTAVSIRIPLE